MWHISLALKMIDSASSIIMDPPCPSNQQRLACASRCDSARIDEAMQKKSAGHFQLACACAFEGLHGGATNEAGINHPAQVGGINQGRLMATVCLRKGL